MKSFIIYHFIMKLTKNTICMDMLSFPIYPAMIRDLMYLLQICIHVSSTHYQNVY